MIEQIKSAVQGAAGKNQKIAMFHYQILKNADELDGLIRNASAKKSQSPNLSRPSSGR